VTGNTHQNRAAAAEPAQLSLPGTLETFGEYGSTQQGMCTVSSNGKANRFRTASRLPSVRLSTTPGQTDINKEKSTGDSELLWPHEGGCGVLFTLILQFGKLLLKV
jgi:hypothetical protein